MTTVMVPRIDPEFRALIPALAANELALLEQSLLEEGCREALVVWDGILLDGHHRLDLCQRHQIQYRTVEAPGSVQTREDAADWIDRQQLGRRNLTPDQFLLLLGRRYNRTKQARGGQLPQAEKGIGQNDQPLSTAEKLAQEHGVSEKTVRRAGQFAAEVEANPALQQAIANKMPVKKAKKARPATNGNGSTKTDVQVSDAQRRHEMGFAGVSSSVTKRIPRRNGTAIIGIALETLRGAVGGLQTLDWHALSEDARAQEWADALAEVIGELRVLLRTLKKGHYEEPRENQECRGSYRNAVVPHS